VARDGGRFAKSGATDLAIHIARGSSAATTAGATAVIAARAGIRVFATGGIGGFTAVRRRCLARPRRAGAHADRRGVGGAKAILDLPRTVEVLETLGVLVIGYRTAEFPAFYTGNSGVRLDHRVDTAAELAAIARARWTSSRPAAS